MPHILIEYTVDSINNQQLTDVMGKVYQSIVESQLFDETNIKLRAIAIEHYRLGSAGKGFIHVQCRIHQGRTAQQKQLISRLVVECLQGMPLALQVITCEIVEMDRKSYSKFSRQELSVST